MTDKEKIHQILSSLWKNNDSVAKMCYNQALQDVQTAIDLHEEPVSDDLDTELDKYIKDNFTIDKEQLDRFGIEEKDYMYSMDKSDLLALVEHVTNWQKTKEESVSEELEKVVEEIVDPTVLNAYGVKEIANRLRRTIIDSVSEDLEEASKNYALNNTPWDDCKDEIQESFKAGAKWQKEHLWKPADGDDLPEIDREVVALLDNGKVVFAHRPPEFWDGKDIVTGKVTRNYPKTYDKGGWNIPNVKWWLDCSMPKEKEL